MICYIVSWGQSWLSVQTSFRNPESDVVRRVSRLPPWPPSWILELNDFVFTYSLGGDVYEEFQDCPWQWRPS